MVEKGETRMDQKCLNKERFIKFLRDWIDAEIENMDENEEDKALSQNTWGTLGHVLAVIESGYFDC